MTQRGKDGIINLQYMLLLDIGWVVEYCIVDEFCELVAYFI